MYPGEYSGMQVAWFWIFTLMQWGLPTWFESIQIMLIFRNFKNDIEVQRIEYDLNDLISDAEYQFDLPWIMLMKLSELNMIWRTSNHVNLP